jgi:hypothetical protein
VSLSSVLQPSPAQPSALEDQNHNGFVVTFAPVLACTKQPASWLKPTEKLQQYYRGGDKSLARPTSRCILLNGKNISFDASLVLNIYSTNIPRIMIINRIYENQNLLSL